MSVTPDLVPMEQAEASNDDLLGRVRDLHSRLRLTNVRVQRLTAECFADLPLPLDTVIVDNELPEYQLEDERLLSRVTYSVGMLDADGERLANVEVSVIVEFALSDGSTPDPDCISAYVDKNARFVAYPYIREVVQSATLRLGLDPIVLGVLNRDDTYPREVNVARRVLGPQD